MHYKDSTGFTYLTQTFLFCTCIPALHDCSGCGLKDFGCWQPTKCMIFLFFFFKLLYIIHKASGWYRKCSTCIEVTLGIKHGVQFGKQITAKVNRSLKYLFFSSLPSVHRSYQHNVAFDLNVWKNVYIIHKKTNYLILRYSYVLLEMLKQNED